jgi:hypothetical protein
VLIADNIDSDKAKVLENSKDIRKEITKSDNLRNIVKLAYKLPLGGIAFHFKSNKEKEQFQKRDNIEEFGTKTFYDFQCSFSNVCLSNHTESACIIYSVNV